VFYITAKLGTAAETVISNNFVTVNQQVRGMQSFAVMHTNNFGGTIEYRLRAAKRTGSPVIPEIYRTRMSMIARWR
jgi:hypothetical protein